MTSERLEIYGREFPKGFQSITNARRVSREKLSGLPASYFPRAAKDGEHLIEVSADPNGVQVERGDILLDLPIDSKAFPGLRGDWEIVQARPRFTRGNDCWRAYFRYLLVRAAKSADAEKARAINSKKNKRVMDWAMNS